MSRYLVSTNSTSRRRAITSLPTAGTLAAHENTIQEGGVVHMGLITPSNRTTPLGFDEQRLFKPPFLETATPRGKAHRLNRIRAKLQVSLDARQPPRLDINPTKRNQYTAARLWRIGLQHLANRLAQTRRGETGRETSAR